MATKVATPALRELFPDKDAVLIYPDDFVKDENGKNIILADLVDRYSGHFSDRRVVVFFRPGVYDDINFPVGYWTQVMGLGETPKDVEFRGSLGVYCLPANTDNPDVGSVLIPVFDCTLCRFPLAWLDIAKMFRVKMKIQ